MNNANQGHGIAGAINQYNSKVKLGNWVEDEFGKILASQSRKPGPTITSTTQAQYLHPKDQPSPPKLAANIPSVAELKAKVKEGTPYDLLFPHGAKEIEQEVNN